MSDERSQAEREEARRSAVAAGQTLERRGLLDAALQAYLAGGAAEDAARLLVGQRRFADAGRVLLDSLGVLPEKAGALEAAGRRLALQAAICFARGGENDPAVKLFVALGEKERAAELLRRSGDPVAAAQLLGTHGRGGTNAPVAQPLSPPASRGVTMAAAQQLEASGKWDLALETYVQLRQPAHAARMAQKAGRALQAGELFVQAGMPYEAAGAFVDAGQPARSLEALLRVPRDDARYRAACVLALRLASDLNALDFQLEHFLSRFLAEPPQNERELEALYAAARLYQKNDFVENAKDAYRKVAAVNPGYRDAGARLAALEAETRGSAMVYEKILREDASFRGDAWERTPGPASAMPDLPDLPGLPGLGTSAPRTGHQTRPLAPSPLPPPFTAAAETPDEAGTFASVPSALKLPAAPRPPGPAPRAPVPPRAPGTPPPMYPVAAPSTNPPGHPPVSAGTPPPRYAPPVIPAPIQPGPAAHTLPPAIRAPAPTVPPAQAPRAPAPTVAPAPAPAAAVPIALALQPGAVFAERYRLVQKIGQGGMASVFKADDLELGEHVAIKVFTKLVEDEQMIARFKQELTLSRQLNHPNIIRLYDIGTVQGYKYITMELLAGDDLKAKLGRPLDVATGTGFLLQACAALQHAHDKGVVHRDVKPANLFVTHDGVVKLMDFGIAKRQATPGLTVAGMIAGTPEYMSPEQISGFDKVTASTDIYALGIMAYEMFTGGVPFRHPEIMPLLVMHMTEPPPPPRSRNPAIPEELERVILKCLEKEAASRFASCTELARALDGVRQRVGGKR